MIRHIHLIFIITIILVGLTISMGQAEDVCRVGDSDLNGNYIFHCFHKYAAVSLTTEYGFLIYRDQFNQPQFVLAKRQERSHESFGLWDDLTDALKKLPRGSTVSIYDRCTVAPFKSYYPLEEKMMQKVRNDFKRIGLNVPNEPVITCTCDELGAEWKMRHKKLLKPTKP